MPWIDVAGPEDECPVCGSNRVLYSDFEIGDEENEGHFLCYCLKSKCGAMWKQNYKMIFDVNKLYREDYK